MLIKVTNLVTTLIVITFSLNVFSAENKEACDAGVSEAKAQFMNADTNTQLTNFEGVISKDFIAQAQHIEELRLSLLAKYKSGENIKRAIEPMQKNLQEISNGIAYLSARLADNENGITDADLLKTTNEVINLKNKRRELLVSAAGREYEAAQKDYYEFAQALASLEKLVMTPYGYDLGARGQTICYKNFCTQLAFYKVSNPAGHYNAAYKISRDPSVIDGPIGYRLHTWGSVPPKAAYGTEFERAQTISWDSQQADVIKLTLNMSEVFNLVNAKFKYDGRCKVTNEPMELSVPR